MRGVALGIVATLCTSSSCSGSAAICTWFDSATHAECGRGGGRGKCGEWSGRNILGQVESQTTLARLAPSSMVSFAYMPLKE